MLRLQEEASHVASRRESVPMKKLEIGRFGRGAGPWAVAAGLLFTLMAGCTKTSTSSSASLTPTTSSVQSSSSPTPTASAVQTPSGSSATSAGLTSVDWKALYYGGTHFPTDCKPDVRQVKYVTPEPGVTEAAVVVSCQGGAGTPPSALLVFDNADTTAPHLLQTLISYYDGLVFGSLSADGPSLAVAGNGYHVSPAEPSSYFYATLAWDWKDGEYQLRTSVPSHAPVCGAPTCTPITTIGQATLP